MREQNITTLFATLQCCRCSGTCDTAEMNGKQIVVRCPICGASNTIANAIERAKPKETANVQ